MSLHIPSYVTFGLFIVAQVGAGAWLAGGASKQISVINKKLDELRLVMAETTLRQDEDIRGNAEKLIATMTKVEDFEATLPSLSVGISDIRRLTESNHRYLEAIEGRLNDGE